MPTEPVGPDTDRGGVGDPVSEALCRLCRAAARPEHALVILAEGNAAHFDGRYLSVTASGSAMSSLEPADITTVDPGPILAALDAAAPTDEQWQAIMTRSRLRGRRASIEAPLHAVVHATLGTSWSLHTHPTDLNKILCSPLTDAFAAQPLFPDQVVVCGPAMCVVPYTDPGYALAVTVRRALQEFAQRHRRGPAVVLLENHGVLCAGHSADDVLAATLMANKAAAVFHGAAALGSPPVGLSAEQVERIDRRDDEAYRRAALSRDDRPARSPDEPDEPEPDEPDDPVEPEPDEPDPVEPEPDEPEEPDPVQPEPEPDEPVDPDPDPEPEPDDPDEPVEPAGDPVD